MSADESSPKLRAHGAARVWSRPIALAIAAAGIALASVAPEARAAGPGVAPKPAASASASSSAAAPVPDVNAEVMLLHATNAGGGIDPKIGSLPALKKPPFSSYDTYRLLSRTQLGMTRGAPAITTLPNGRVLQITLRDVLPEHRYRVAASINQPRGTTFLPLLEVTVPAGEPFFVAGQSYQGGMLVIGITVR